MKDSMGPGKLVRHMQNPSYTYDKYLICMGLGPSILSVIDESPSYSGPSYPSSPVLPFLDTRNTTKRLYDNDNLKFSKIHNFNAKYVLKTNERITCDALVFLKKKAKKLNMMAS